MHYILFTKEQYANNNNFNNKLFKIDKITISNDNILKDFTICSKKHEIILLSKSSEASKIINIFKNKYKKNLISVNKNLFTGDEHHMKSDILNLIVKSEGRFDEINYHDV